MTKRMEIQRKLVEATGGCAIQHDGWPCGTCFYTLPFATNELWQSVLAYRGDYKLSHGGGAEIPQTQEQVDTNIKYIDSMLK